MWKIASDETGPGAVLDESSPKTRGEVLVNGRCFTRGVPRSASSVRVAIGSVDKTLYVVGDRRWGALGASDPEPFTEMPVTWRRAFGGEGFAQNPLGRGFAAEANLHPLPNVEDPKHLLKTQNDRPAPAGFEGYDLTWPQRTTRLGTYDDRWLEHDRPGFPRDFDPAYFDTAPPDQQLDGYFRGDEAFRIENMHPTEAVLEGTLPGLVARCFITRGDGLVETAMRLDTVRFFPHRERGILVFRGVFEIGEDDAADVDALVAALEVIGEPRPRSHYETVLAQRTDKEKRHLYMLRDGDLIPLVEEAGADPLPDDRLSGIAALLKRDDYHRKHIEARRAREQREEHAHVTAARKQLQDAGIDPDPTIPAGPPPAPAKPPAVPSLNDLPAFVAQLEEEAAAQRAQAQREAEEALASARARAAQHQIDFGKMAAAARKDAGSSRKDLDRLNELSTKDELRKEMRERLSDPALAAKLSEQEEEAKRAQRRHAHHFPASARLEGDEARRLREEVIAGREAKQSFAHRDLTGADLSHLDLHGMDFRDAILEAAVLAGADLRDADLTSAVCAHADLDGADLTGAKLTGANFGGATLRDIKARGIDLTGTIFAKANLSGADFAGATISSADFSEATGTGADFTGVRGEKAFFLRNDFSGATFAGSTLLRCVFIEPDVSGADFRGADLRRTTFIAARGDGVVFTDGKLDRFRLVKDCSFTGADFRRASMKKANLLGAALSGSDFTDANLTGALLTNADLSGATLDRAIATDAMLVRTNLRGASLFAVDLMNGVLQKTDLSGADLEKANLFGADASGMIGDGDTSLSGANVKRVNVLAAGRPREQG
ncbi:hypothetical protein A7982_13713 [Minicystis rosea]|nr:hypothetical protein A7982_13713 [Minicystis rosea]